MIVTIREREYIIDDSNKIFLVQRWDFKKAENLIIKPQKYFTVFSAKSVSCDVV